MRHHVSCWNKTLTKLGFRRLARRPRPHTNIRRVSRIEPLETRQMLAITVDTFVDENDGAFVGNTSLREAIAVAASYGNEVVFEPLAGRPNRRARPWSAHPRRKR